MEIRVSLHMFEPIPLNLPPYKAQLKRSAGKLFIFDILRRKYLQLTPEEWVRQHWVNFLQQMGYPKNLMAIEAGLQVHGQARRSDLMVYDKSGAPLLLAEFKAPSVKIDQKVIDQIAAYNITHKTPYLLVSNGLNHFIYRVNFSDGSVEALLEFPFYQTLTNPE